MITQIRGILRHVAEEELTLGVDAFDVEVLIPEFVRRRLQSKLGEMVALTTVFYVEGNQMGGRMNPRLVGFLSPVEREFFEVFCSVDGVGVRKALRAMVLPVRDLARTIQDQDVRMLATFPGVGEALAERIVAKLRRKVGKFALIVGATAGAETNGTSHGSAPASTDLEPEPDVIRDTFAALLTVGHNESQARGLIDRALAKKKRYRSVAELIEAIYNMRDE